MVELLTRFFAPRAASGSFLGREWEIEEISARLEKWSGRAAVTQHAGSGKTQTVLRHVPSRITDHAQQRSSNLLCDGW